MVLALENLKSWISSRLVVNVGIGASFGPNLAMLHTVIVVCTPTCGFLHVYIVIHVIDAMFCASELCL